MNPDTALQNFHGKYPEIDKSDELKSKVMTMAATQCPDPMSQVSMK